MKVSAFKVDSAKVREGGWVDTGMDGLWLKVRGLHNRTWIRRNTELVEAVPLDDRPDGKLSEEDREEHVSILLHETVLLDWHGLTDDDDKPLAYDADLARQMLTHPDFEEFRGAVWAAAAIVGKHGRESYEAAEGNSSARSSGASNGASAKSGSSRPSKAKNTTARPSA